MTDLQLYLLTPADWARALNLLLCLACFAAMAWDWRRFVTVSRAAQMMRLSMGVFVAATTLGSWETLTDPDPAPGVRTFAYTIALSWLLVSIVWDRRDNRSNR